MNENLKSVAESQEKYTRELEAHRQLDD